MQRPAMERGRIRDKTRETLARDVDWYFRHKMLGEPIAAIARAEFGGGGEERRKDVRGGIGRAPAETSARRDDLVDGDAGRPGGEPQRTNNEVIVAARGWRTVGHTNAIAFVIDVETIGEVERDHLGVDQMESVITKTRDAQRERQLGRREDLESDTTAMTAACVRDHASSCRLTLELSRLP